MAQSGYTVTPSLPPTLPTIRAFRRPSPTASLSEAQKYPVKLYAFTKTMRYFAFIAFAAIAMLESSLGKCSFFR